MDNVDLNFAHIEHFSDRSQFLEALQKKKEARIAFLNSRIISQSVDPVVAQSWIRSEYAGVDPYRLSVKHLSDAELKDRRKKNEVLLRFAKPLMHQLSQISTGHISLITLHDSEGYMLELFNNQDPSKVWYDKCFCPGVRWQEKDVGTNALALALIEKKPIQLLGMDHYFCGHQNVCCCAAPIQETSGEVAGVLNVSSSVENFSEHIMTMVILSCYALSSQLREYYSLEIDKIILNAFPNGVIIINCQQTIIQYNNNAADMFQGNSNSLLNMYIQDIIHIPGLAYQMESSSKKSSYYRDCRSCYNGTNQLYDIVVTPIYKHGRELGAVLNVKNREKTVREGSVLMGNYARVSLSDIYTTSPAIQELVRQLSIAAESDDPIFICGEPGTDKDVFAQAVHLSSSRKKMPFLILDCEMVSASLLENELFGCEKDFVGESMSCGYMGKLELADGGTLFLNNIECMSYQIQVELTTALKSHRFSRIGSPVERVFNTRIIAASRRDLSLLSGSQEFSSELFSVFSSNSFIIPPLRTRRDDIRQIAEKTLSSLNEKLQMNKSFSASFIDFLEQQSWLGNNHELINFVEKAYYCGSKVIIPDDKNNNSIKLRTQLSKDSFAHAAIRDMVFQALIACDYDVSQAADYLGISRATMYRRIKKYNITLHKPK